MILTEKQEIVDALKKLIEQYEAGEVNCAAMRVYGADGTFEDIVLGGDSEHERAEALAALHARFARLN